MRSETVAHAYSPQAGIASGFDVYVGVANDRSFFRTHAVFLEQLARAFRLGLLGGKAVSAIDLGKEWAQTECVDDSARRHDRFVREHRQLTKSAVRFLSLIGVGA